MILVLISVKTRGFGLIGSSPRPAQDVARERCQADVRKQLASPESAQLSDVRSAAGGLQADGQDMFPLMTDEPLKGVDHSRITVWNVSGMIDAKAEAGGTIHDPFTCRAYFVDGNLADTLVLFDHAH
ncbi:hypothetical protein OS122_13550 [Mycolicibacterium mucogenicum]|uniref:hypothetical protein n=1 Tax=Mycolicibacterium mucogenicum TaxID=56689 RepID=UPI002269F4DF|nr:hypothetical protein [Mycolicibacterium mucogenicum]MCX8561913.1 hypothetical protein [Mycolicibacterium mucogenicum]